MGSLCGLLEIAFVHSHDLVGRPIRRNSRRLQDLVVKRNRQFSLVQVGSEENMKIICPNNGLCRGCPFQRVDQGLGCEMDLGNYKASAQLQVLEWSEIEHNDSISGRASFSHPQFAPNSPFRRIQVASGTVVTQ